MLRRLLFAAALSAVIAAILSATASYEVSHTSTICGGSTPYTSWRVFGHTVSSHLRRHRLCSGGHWQVAWGVPFASRLASGCGSCPVTVPSGVSPRIPRPRTRISWPGTVIDFLLFWAPLFALSSVWLARRRGPHLY